MGSKIYSTPKISDKAFPGGALNRKAIVLLSGGLDSTLAVKLMQEQGLDVLALNFTSPFCTCSSRVDGSCHMASDVARSLNVKIQVVSKGMDYMKVVENARYGRGRGINPCIDCRIFSFQKTKKIMEEVGASFVVTGTIHENSSEDGLLKKFADAIHVKI